MRGSGSGPDAGRLWATFGRMRSAWAPFGSDAVRIRYGCGPVVVRMRSTCEPRHRPQEVGTDESRLEFVRLVTPNRANTECQGECRIGGLPPSCERCADLTTLRLLSP